MIGYLQATFDAVEKQGGRITIIWMSPQRYAEFRSSVRDLPDVTSVLASFDLVTERGALRNGLRAVLWGAEIRVDPKEPDIRFDLEGNTESYRPRPTRWDIIGA